MNRPFHWVGVSEVKDLGSHHRSLTKIMSDNVAEEQAPASAADEFYGEDMFDDLIAKAMESEPKNNGGGSKKKKSKSKRNKKDDDSIDIVADIEAGNNNNDDDINDNDANSLDSGEISGESDISEVEEKVKSYIAPPLVNDDESTIDMRPPAPANRDQTVSSYVDQLNQQERSKSRLIRVGAFAILIAIVVGVILAVISLTGDKGGDGAITDGNSFTVANPGAEGDGPQKVSPSSPEVEGTVEIQNMGIPTAKPTTIQPVPTEIVDTIHPVQLTFDNVPLGYRLPEDDRESIIGFLTELLKDYLDDSFGLLGVAYARDIGGVDIGKKKKRYLIPSTTRRRRLESISLPLVIRLSGPSNFSEDFVRAYVIEVIEDRVRNIASYLKAVDYDAFKSVRISPSTYDINDVLKPTPAPSVSPVTSTPSVSPQRTPSVSPTLPPQTSGPTKEEVPETSDIVVGTIVNSAPTKPPTRRPKPTREPSRPPSRYPTVEPTPVSVTLVFVFYC